MAIFKSKKFWMSIAGVFTILLSEWVGLSEDKLMGIAGIFISYVIGQGIADKGKEAERVKAESNDYIGDNMPESSDQSTHA